MIQEVSQQLLASQKVSVVLEGPKEQESGSKPAAFFWKSNWHHA